MTSRRWDVDGILIGHAHSLFSERVSHAVSSDKNVVRMHYGLKGDYRFTYQQLNTTFDLVGSHHNIMYSSGFDITIENKTMAIETFGVQFPVDRFIRIADQGSDELRRFADNVAAGRNVIFSKQWGPIDPGIQQVIREVIQNRYTSDMQRVFMVSRSLELLVLSVESYAAVSSRKQPFIKTKTDREKLIAVRDLVNDRVHQPPHLSEIAQAVGLNEYKLKRGFKEVFNTTVFGYLTDQRLHLALQYLRDTTRTAAEIATDLGYATPQHFNNAFKKKFGRTPFAARKNP